MILLFMILFIFSLSAKSFFFESTWFFQKIALILFDFLNSFTSHRGLFTDNLCWWSHFLDFSRNLHFIRPHSVSGDVYWSSGFLILVLVHRKTIGHSLADIASRHRSGRNGAKWTPQWTPGRRISEQIWHRWTETISFGI